MTLDSFYATLFTAPLMVPLLGSLVTGVLIGAEREVQGKPAGLRTHTLVCFGSALMMLIAAYQASWDMTLTPGTQIVSDLSRMPHAILTGIGFLGAGVIFREGLSVQGLTTAASLWLTASLGIVYGAGLVELAVIGTLIVLVVLVILRLMQYLLPARTQWRISLSGSPALSTTTLKKILAAEGLEAGPMTVSFKDETVTLETTAKLWGGGMDVDALCAALRGSPGVYSASLTPTE